MPAPNDLASSRSFKVFFWVRDQTEPSKGYTSDLSSDGLSIAAQRTPPVGTRVRVEIVDAERGFLAEAEVTHRDSSGNHMGVRLLETHELVANLLSSHSPPPVVTRDPAPRDRAHCVVYPDLGAFRSAFFRDMVSGGLFVPTHAPPPLGTVIDLEISITRPERAAKVRARVVQHVRGQHEGIGVEFMDRDSALKSARQLLDD